MANDVEQRLARLEDLMAIHQLFVDYGHHLDVGDLDAYVALFTPDGALKLGPFGAVSGHEAIREMMVKATDGLVGSSYHIISSPRVVLDGDRATTEVMWTVIQRDDAGNPTVPMIGRHKDVLVKVGDQWKIQERRGFVDIPSAVRR